MTAQSAGEQPEAKQRDDAGIWITLRESPLAVKAMLAGVFVNKLGGFIVVFLVLFMIHRGFTPVQAGAALSLDGAGAVLGILAGGSLSDWLGPRRATLISMFGSAVLVLSILYVRNFAGLLVVVTLLGAVGVIYRPAAAALLSELTPENRQVMIMAQYRLALNVGTTAAPLIGAALAAISWNLLFWGEALADLGYAIIAVFALPRYGASAKPSDGSAAAAQKLRGFLVLLSDRRFAVYTFALFINAVVYWQYVSVLPLAMRSAGLIIAWYAALVALNSIIVICFELLMTKVTQRWQPRVVVMIGFVLLGAGMSVYSVPWGVGVFVAGTLIWTLGEIVAGPTVFAYPAMVAPEGFRARYLGTSQAMFALGAAVGPAAGVAVWHAFGRAVWLWCGAACVVGLLCARFSMKTIPRGSTAEAPASGDAETAAPDGAAGTVSGVSDGSASG
jgi:MFS family permease